jgi:hypothetical protein
MPESPEPLATPEQADDVAPVTAPDNQRLPQLSFRLLLQPLPGTAGPLDDLKKSALEELRPLVGKLDLPAEEKIRHTAVELSAPPTINPCLTRLTKPPSKSPTKPSAPKRCWILLKRLTILVRAVRSQQRKIYFAGLHNNSSIKSCIYF